MVRVSLSDVRLPDRHHGDGHADLVRLHVHLHHGGYSVLGRVERAKKTEEEWKATVERMVGKGTQLSQAEQELVVQHLAEAYPE